MSLKTIYCAMKGMFVKLPNLEQVVTPKEKFTTYLLDETHPEGQGKALFFHHFGFSGAEWQLLARAFIAHAYKHDIVKIQSTKFGTRYVVEGELDTPIRRKPLVRVVWFIPDGETAPRLITAYPLEEA